MGVTVINEAGPFVSPTMWTSPSTAETFYVGTTLPAGQIAEKIADRFYTTVDKALNACVSGRGDTILVLAGYTENIATADAWSSLGTKTDVTIRGLGRGTNRPLFTWSAAGSTMLMDAANFKIFNVQMQMAGDPALTAALTVAAPITVSAAGCEISDSFIQWGVDADQIVTIGITTTAAATHFSFNRNRCWGPVLAVPTTTFLRLTGTDHLQMLGTHIIGPGSTVAIGPVQQLTTAGLDVEIVECFFQNTLASSTHSFTAIAGCRGIVHQCGFGVLASGNGLTTGSGLQVTDSWTAVAGAAGVATTG